MCNIGRLFSTEFVNMILPAMKRHLVFQLAICFGLFVITLHELSYFFPNEELGIKVFSYLIGRRDTNLLLITAALCSAMLREINMIFAKVYFLTCCFGEAPQSILEVVQKSRILNCFLDESPLHSIVCFFQVQHDHHSTIPSLPFVNRMHDLLENEDIINALPS